MTDHEIIEAVCALDLKDVELDTYEAGFVESMVRSTQRGDWEFVTLSEKQRRFALGLIEKYEAEKSGDQEVIRKLPPGAEKYFRRPS